MIEIDESEPGIAPFEVAFMANENHVPVLHGHCFRSRARFGFTGTEHPGKEDYENQKPGYRH